MAASPRSITILGATGSIGVSTLDVLRHMEPEAFTIEALTGASNIPLLAQQAKACHARLAVTADEARYHDLRDALSGTDIEVAAGRQAVIEAASRPVDVTMAAIVGIAGLAPTLAAVRHGGTIALANKECLVCAGSLFMRECETHGVTLLPVDSEHNAIYQVLAGQRREAVQSIILTASGGPFRTWGRERMANVTAQTAADHPNWSMGLKISIDSASMFNKALEMIEAQHLFTLTPEQVEVIVHPQSIVHSMVRYCDGSVLAQLGPADMRIPIAYALAWPDRMELPADRLDFTALSRLDFEAPDEARFPAIMLARRALAEGGASGAVLNGAKEAALDGFIEGRIGFLDMADRVELAMESLAGLPEPQTLSEVEALDRQARTIARG
ncbi:1-deoxy-D-xylulose-5-phosphate reductoisomerase [Notoacmeibacter sp. MSK16QG-6]|uniref:1-deoxy-D-xylulose-5-phosphate reductoisomerase n=1 Tax=Notoacmeibacter sp. MSK16QG-6 TaxID=2957982 RepID=UPI0020A12874|nr:1-deoxy-D-xylulose-5-phosphate reductoisomerase [Notoacmeibacter sp. MSK16QG-6]MCP1199273.1 1-deoxy-D-xylulose-5-phosphate reductoisomerase [Notoacmeibacter sp. MSK16QG-6]